MEGNPSSAFFVKGMEKRNPMVFFGAFLFFSPDLFCLIKKETKRRENERNAAI